MQSTGGFVLVDWEAYLYSFGAKVTLFTLKSTATIPRVFAPILLMAYPLCGSWAVDTPFIFFSSISSGFTLEVFILADVVTVSLSQ